MAEILEFPAYKTRISHHCVSIWCSFTLPTQDDLFGDAEDSDDDPLLDTDRSMSGMNRVQRGVDSVVDVMKDNIGKVLDRGDRLEQIEERSEGLMEGAEAFRSGSNRVRRQMWWQKIRLQFLIGGVVAVFVLFFIVWCFVL
ncbi:hypothetical protein SARC_00759 [Sphaeroforma arctica JP610]|uniref:V-SNARE coiled-coil homology domain-containing protein n=1 Tax=Sphaeroforma arctica JP610 TaxID=667725 RepID=A0A0L0GE35_9EUKA|nr:hypothetical protein SARC_00759 [Sphaeroforma arctica JP610]KNC87136.1 hypothetical protein SARC_00759 [Sphaeroforma arctica JP610]|eukprot:XP_014161038.1 hypothetical protein SARC_00759 [Sphaeroforma arctica JP610]